MPPSINVNSTLQKAKSLARKGEAPAAARLYQSILEQFPANRLARQGLAALDLGSAAATQAGARPSERELMELIRLYNGGHLLRAAEQGGVLAERCPDDPLVHNLVGAANAGLQRYDTAIAGFRRAIELKPDYAEAYRNLGAVFNSLDRNGEAIDSYSRAIRLEPRAADAHYNLANALKDSGRQEEAIASYETAIALQPGYAEAYTNLGNVLQKLGRYAQARECLRTAIRKNPGSAQAYNNLGNVFHETGELEEAVACHRRAIELNPAFAESLCNMANSLSGLGRFDEAIASCRRAIELRPADDKAYNVLGSILIDQGDYPGVVRCFSAAVTQRPDNAAARAQLLHWQAHMGEWEAIRACAELIPRLGVAGEAVQPFSLLPLEDSPERHCERSKLYAGQTIEFTKLPPVPRPSAKPERLRIGYFSADFYSHATLYLMMGLFEQHDRERFAVHAFSFGPQINDAMRDRLKAAVECFHDVSTHSDREIAELARAEGIDIAIDLKGFTQHGHPGIFALRAAPVQVSYLGYPGTLGMPAMDYIIADPVVIPAEQRRHYTEEIIYLPNSYQVNDRSREISDKAMSREELGLPDGAFVFCCFNNNYKISPAEFDVWMRLLMQVEGSVLWLLQTNEWSAAAFSRHARERGVDPGRIILARKELHPEHLARHRFADLFLDCFNYNAHTTASDALWAGLPLVTLQGEGFAARVGASLLTAIGLPELIARSVQEYEQLALDLALHPGRLAAVREKLAGNRLTAPLFDTALYTRHIERAYEDIYQAYFEGQSPGTIHVPAGDTIDETAGAD